MNRIWSEGLQIFKGERRSVCFLWVSCLRKSSVGFVIMQGTCLEACGWQPYNAIKWSSEMEFRRSNKNKITCKPISYGMKTNWCHYFIRILLDLCKFRAHRPIFRRVRTAVHTTIGSYSICTALVACSVCCAHTFKQVTTYRTRDQNGTDTVRTNGYVHSCTNSPEDGPVGPKHVEIQ